MSNIWCNLKEQGRDIAVCMAKCNELFAKRVLKQGRKRAEIKRQWRCTRFHDWIQKNPDETIEVFLKYEDRISEDYLKTLLPVLPESVNNKEGEEHVKELKAEKVQVVRRGRPRKPREGNVDPGEKQQRKNKSVSGTNGSVCRYDQGTPDQQKQQAM